MVVELPDYTNLYVDMKIHLAYSLYVGIASLTILLNQPVLEVKDQRNTSFKR